jgi:gliding motility-associated lipoprotein GldJ
MLFLAASLMFGTGCSKQAKLNRVSSKSSKTGVKYGGKKDTDVYRPKEWKERSPAPGLVLIPGGTFLMGGGEKDIEYAMNNRQRQVTVQSFYLDETEVANVHWKEFLFDIQQEDQTKFEELYPDTNVWRRDLAFNDPIAETYYNHPAFDTYPVVGVTWHQVNEYCKWRTQKVNDQLLEKNDEAVLYPSYRLPTEAEWEYAARGLLESEIYAWEGKSLRNRKGNFRANFKRGRGDYAGWRGGDGKHMTDRYMITAPIYEFWPNDFGLYNMSGNVSEWTQDTYRILALEDVEDFNPFRRKGRTEIRPDDWLDDISYKQKESLLFNPDPDPSTVGNDNYDNVKVYRGGSWADIAYFLSPGSRRFFNADSSSAMIGFRCAMIKVGSPE